MRAASPRPTRASSPSSHRREALLHEPHRPTIAVLLLHRDRVSSGRRGPYFPGSLSRPSRSGGPAEHGTGDRGRCSGIGLGISRWGSNPFRRASLPATTNMLWWRDHQVPHLVLSRPPAATSARGECSASLLRLETMDTRSRVETVSGPVGPDELGPTLVHEHILHDLTPIVPRPSDDVADMRHDEPLNLENVWWARQGGWSADNFVLSDRTLAVREVAYFREAGGRTLVELTPRSMGRKPELLRAVSEETGVHIIAASGYPSSLPQTPDDGRSVDDLANDYVHEITVEMSSGIRAGVLQLMPLGRPIDDVGEMLPVDLVGIRATAQAHLRTGVAISLEPPRPKSMGQVSRADLGLAILDFLLSEGVSPGRVAVTTLDSSVLDLPDRSRAIRRIADRGSFIQIGLWGAEPYAPTIPSDWQRTQLVIDLLHEGYREHLLFGDDAASKMRLRSYGGRGYAHIPSRVRSMLASYGVSADDLDQILIDNPRRLLTPRAASGEGPGGAS